MAEFRKLQKRPGKAIWSTMGQSDVDYADVNEMINVLGLLTIIVRICLFNDTSK